MVPSRALCLRSSQWQRFVRFFSTVRPRSRPQNFFDSDYGGRSAVYSHALKYARPATVKWANRVVHLQNSVSFIGSVVSPPKKYATQSVSFGVHTLLEVHTSRDSCSLSRFRIQIEMWNEMAELAIEHLRPNDFIYVSGHLGSYERAFENGNREICYKVRVEEFNYVRRLETSHHAEISAATEPSVGLSASDKYRNNLHLWQVFFCNPFEWYDCRRSKKNPKEPDFKHKDTGEALWLRINDPPWVRRQLQLYDSRM
ncbi:Protein osb1, mitochondrial-like [Ancistrocladus abbreviatus]